MISLSPFPPKFMKTPAKSLTQLVIGTVAGMGLISVLLAQPVWAQLNNVNPLEDINSPENRDPLSSSDRDSSGFSVLDLIHRANLGSGRSIDDFNAEQNESLDAAAAQFRDLQRKRLNPQQQTTPPNQRDRTLSN